MFEKEEERTIAKAKTIHFIQNGHPEKIFTESFAKPLLNGNIGADSLETFYGVFRKRRGSLPTAHRTKQYWVRISRLSCLLNPY